MKQKNVKCNEIATDNILIQISIFLCTFIHFNPFWKKVQPQNGKMGFGRPGGVHKLRIQGKTLQLFYIFRKFHKGVPY